MTRTEHPAELQKGDVLNITSTWDRHRPHTGTLVRITDICFTPALTYWTKTPEDQTVLLSPGDFEFIERPAPPDQAGQRLAATNALEALATLLDTRRTYQTSDLYVQGLIVHDLDRAETAVHTLSPEFVREHARTTEARERQLAELTSQLQHLHTTWMNAAETPGHPEDWRGARLACSSELGVLLSSLGIPSGRQG